MQTYKSKDIIELAGITKIQLNHWVNMRALKPHIDDRRRGGVRYFDEQGLFEAFICKCLNEHRLPVQNISSAVQMIRGFQIDDGKTFFEAYNLNPELENYFAVVVPLTGFSKEGSTEASRAINPPVPFKDGDSPLYKRMPMIFSFEKLASVLTEVPSAIVINLNSIIKEVKAVIEK